ncbi:hypothetical protein [Alienimonas chondri]|uniref:DUF1269 domain-containing protein n=1 Tax=Alienimonas chondri TaxID=2681879 RepID=A0ABX1VH61_9PLAN|nr:hypothetical protein [Alienimonas chondri]NNJ27139.1 hypothetical protein [Alienimonas chondri]
MAASAESPNLADAAAADQAADANAEAIPVRAAVVAEVEAADRLIDRLAEAGFTVAEISVLCSDEVKEAHFRRFEHEDPAGDFTPQAIASGGVTGLLVAGAVAAVGAATGGLAVIGAAAVAGAGGISGSFLGAMLTRGNEGELADFYDQAVREGQILIGVEVHGPRSAARLAKVEEIFAAEGVRSLSLADG